MRNMLLLKQLYTRLACTAGLLSLLLAGCNSDVFIDEFMPGEPPSVTIERADGHRLVTEVRQHIGDHVVRTVAMDSTDGVSRGMAATATGQGITVPVGDQVKGRLLNVTGEPIDGIGPLSRQGAYPIHREPPRFEDLAVS